MPDAPKGYILQAIATNEALIPPLRAKLQMSERVKEKLIEETNIIFDKAIQSLGKPGKEEIKEHMLPN
jgi:hypothetical protein